MMSRPQLQESPRSIHVGTAEDGEEARRQLQHKKRSTPTSIRPLSHIFSKNSSPSPKSKAVRSEFAPSDTQASSTTTADVFVGDSRVNEVSSQTQSETRDKYQWAIIYENQRGARIFSTPYYSHQSLLPIDPAPFTIPSTSLSTQNSKPVRPYKSSKSNVSLEDYPLPDGSWRWVSKHWMIDMRGAVQHDGFEYNWFFRYNKWSPNVGTMSAGGWVRRRQWVRLMMRPADRKSEHDGDDRASHSSTNDEIAIWTGDDGDWSRCHWVMKHLDRDGVKLDLWKKWLGLEADSPSKSKRKQRTDHDDLFPPSEPAPERIQVEVELGTVHRPDLDHIADVLKTHGHEILQLFIYPASRAEFLQLLSDVGLHGAIQATPPSSPIVDFWSRSKLLEQVERVRAGKVARK